MSSPISASPILDQILADVKEAMKARAQRRVDTLRTLHSDIKNVAINEKKEISDEVCLDVLSKTVKQKTESIEQFRAGNRLDLVAEEEEKMGYIRSYLPEPLSSAELEQIVKEAIAESGATDKKGMGAVMKLVGPKTKGRADGKAVSALVQQLLN